MPSPGGVPSQGGEYEPDEIYLYTDEDEDDDEELVGEIVGESVSSAPSSAGTRGQAASSKSAKAGTGGQAVSSKSADWRKIPYSRFVSLGAELAHRIRYEHEGPSGDSMSWTPGDDGEITWFGGIVYRMFFGGNWGFGFEGLIMDYHKIRGNAGYAYTGLGGYQGYIMVEGYDTTVMRWLCDFDLLYRYPLTPKILLNAGAGLSMDAVTWETKDRLGEKIASGSEVGALGFNLKLGVEYFVSTYWSITLDWKWQTWRTGAGGEKFTISSIVAGLAWTI